MIDYFSENLWQLWAITAVACMILELTSGDLFILCFGLGGLVSAVASPFIPNFYVQISVFVIASLLCVYTVRPVAWKWLHRNESGRVSNADAIIGRIGTVSEPIEACGYGRVAIDGDDWKAKTADGSAVGKGCSVKVLSRESVIVTVEKM